MRVKARDNQLTLDLPAGKITAPSTCTRGPEEYNLLLWGGSQGAHHALYRPALALLIPCKNCSAEAY